MATHGGVPVCSSLRDSAMFLSGLKFGAIRITGIVERTAVILDRTAVSFWGQTSQILTSLSPKRGCGPRRVEQYSVTLLSNIRVFASVARPAM